MALQDKLTKFFDSCETCKGWEVAGQYCNPDATFVAQSEPLVNIRTLKEYVEWMKGFGTTTTPGCSYTLHHFGIDHQRNSGSFFATFHGTHTGPGPVPATNKSTNSHYVYVVSFDPKTEKITGMTKIWNAPWAMKEMGWM